MKTKSNLKLAAIIVASIIAVAVMSYFGIQSSQNKAISYEESVNAAKYDIKTQEKRRVDLLYNLADCVKKYDTHESETLKSIAEKMGKGEDTGDVNTTISAVVYSYPDLKSNENYKQLMTDITTTENLIAQYRENYNQTITEYNRYVKKFPTRIFLDWTGYEVQNYERLDYDAPEDSPRDLFEE